MNYHQIITEIWSSNKNEIEKTICSWALGLRENAKTLHDAKKKFHQWEPLRVYTNVTQAKTKKGNTLFSLRYFGQDIAKLMVNEDDIKVQINDKKIITNNHSCPVRELHKFHG